MALPVKLYLLLHALMPSDQVCLCLPFLSFAQSPNQEPPGEQQLGTPDFVDIPHLEHTELFVLSMGVLVDAEVTGMHVNNWA